MQRSRIQTWGGAALIAAATLAVYLPCLHGGFLFDDALIAEESEAIRAPDGLSRLWFHAEMPNFEPLTYSVFWLGWQFWGDDTFGYHLINIALHALASILLWRVVRRLGIPGAWLAGLLFALHPVNVQSAAYIFQIRNTLSTSLAFGAALCYLRFETDPKRRWYAGAATCFTLALLSKAAIVMAPLLLLGAAWWQRGRVTRQDVLRAAPLLVLSLTFGLLEIWFQSHRAIGTWVVRDDGLLGRIAVAGWAVCFYLRNALAPYELMFIHPRWSVDLTAVLTYLPALALSAFAVVLWRFRHTWGRHGLAAFGFYVIALLPVLGFLDIAFMRYAYVADHWQYLALAAPVTLFAAAIALLAKRWSPPYHYAFGAVTALVVVTLGGLTWQHARLFGDPEQLWRDNYARNPGSPMVCFSLGAELGKLGRHDEARALYQEALRLDPRFVEAQVNLGSTLMLQGDFAGAHYHYTRALQSEPGSPRNQISLAGALVRLGRADEAIPLYRNVLERSRRFQARARLGLGVAYLQCGQAKPAVEQLTAAVAANPADATALKLLGDALAQSGDFRRARERYQEALAKDATQASAHVGLGTIAAHEGRHAEAEACFRRALDLQPDLAAAHGAWGESLARQGKRDEAKWHFTEALRLDPDCVEAHAALGDLALAEGQPARAIEHYRAAVQRRPRHAELRKALGDLLAEQGKPGEALEQYRVSLAAQPDALAVIGRIAWLLATDGDATLRNGREAVELAERLCRQTGARHPVALDTLAAAYAEDGRFADAIQTARRAAEAARAGGQENLVREVTSRLALYEKGLPFHARP